MAVCVAASPTISLCITVIIRSTVSQTKCSFRICAAVPTLPKFLARNSRTRVRSTSASFALSHFLADLETLEQLSTPDRRSRLPVFSTYSLFLHHARRFGRRRAWWGPHRLEGAFGSLFHDSYTGTRCTLFHRLAETPDCPTVHVFLLIPTPPETSISCIGT